MTSMLARLFLRGGGWEMATFVIVLRAWGNGVGGWSSEDEGGSVSVELVEEVDSFLLQGGVGISLACKSRSKSSEDEDSSINAEHVDDVDSRLPPRCLQDRCRLSSQLPLLQLV